MRNESCECNDIIITPHGTDAIAWKQKYRFFGCSRDLSHAMKRPVIDDPCYTWLCTSAHRPDRGHDEDKIIRKNPTWTTGIEVIVSINLSITFGSNDYSI